MDTVKRKAVYAYTCPTCGSAFTVYGNSHRKYCCHEYYIADRSETEQDRQCLYEATKAEREKVAADIQRRGIRRREFERFITKPEKLSEAVSEFDEALRGQPGGICDRGQREVDGVHAEWRDRDGCIGI